MPDAFVKELNKNGFQPVFLPRTGLRPPDLYTWVDKRLALEGPLEKFLPDDVEFEVVPGTTANIDVKRASTKKHGGSVDFLKKALACVGIDSAPKLDLSFASTSELAFSFAGVTVATVVPADIRKVMPRLDLSSLPREIREGGQLHVAYEYAYAESLLMSRKDQKELGVGASGALGQYIDLGAKGSAKLASSTTIAFSSNGGEHAAFAFKVGQIRRDIDQRWNFYTDESMQSGGVPTTRPILVARGVVLDVEVR